MTTTTTAKLYCVNFWGSHPEEGNDDCWTGCDFDTAEEAMERYLSDENPFTTGYDPSFMTTSCAYVEIDGPDVDGVRKNPLYNTRAARRERDREDALWDREAVWQARMMGDLSE